MLSGNTWTLENEAQLQKAKDFFAPIEPVLNRFVSECNVRAEPYPKGCPQGSFRFRTPENRTGIIAMWQEGSGFGLAASHYDWMTSDRLSGWYHLPRTIYPDSSPDTVWRGLIEQLKAILSGEGVYEPEPFPRYDEPERVEGRRRATLELPIGRRPDVEGLSR